MILPVWRLAELIVAYECVDESEAWRRALATPDRSGEADKTAKQGLAEGESGLPEGSSE